MDLQDEKPPWRVPPHVSLERDGLVVLLDPDAPNWIATDARGARVLSWLDGQPSLDGVAARYAHAYGCDQSKAWLHVSRFTAEAARRGFASRGGPVGGPYAGREAHLEPQLRELWIHTNNSCNLACAHCLVGSGPGEDGGLASARLLDLIDEAAALGVERYYLTGGEPLLRPDAFDLAERVTTRHQRELHILTNGLLFQGDVLDRLWSQDPQRLRLQLSLDGASAAVNDVLRGRGTFERVLAGVRTLAAAGFAPTVSTVLTRDNVGQMKDMVRLVRDLGAASWHLLWIHKKGRWSELNGAFVPPDVILPRLREAQAEADRLGVVIDNVEAFRQQVNGAPGSRIDLSNAGVSSVCVYADGRVYPSAATVQYGTLQMGRWTGGNLSEILATSAVGRRLRRLTVAEKPVCRDCRYRFLCGGGDVEHSFSFGAGRGPGGGDGPFDTLDPYCGLYQGMMEDAFFVLAERGRIAHRSDTGYGAPVIFHAMGEGNPACAAGGDLGAFAPVRTLRSNCVRPPDVAASRRLVQDFYAAAAATPQADLCCPVSYDAADTAHIPREVLERFYGCGGPMSVAGVQPGETVVDLGSGAGIDVFIAARKVGPAGRAIGIDMTDPMLGIAGRSRAGVAANLGYDVVEFHKGYLENVPLPAGVADLVTSNCVINLSPDKRRVFGEAWRVLKDHGRLVVSDIVADRALPPGIKVNAHLWGECVSGASSEEEFLAEVERAGFFGVCLLQKRFWREVAGCRFHSVTVRAFKFQKKAGCVFLGHQAVYLGPYVSVADEEGHLFPRAQAVEVCTDTLAKLRRDPYRGSFAIIEPGEGAAEVSCEPGSGCC